jgi:lipoprotein-releasing system permease protein
MSRSAVPPIASGMPFGLFLALRYLKPRGTFVSVITLISILGVTLGVMLLIVVISVMTGFDQELQRKILGFDAHLLVTNNQILDNWREVSAEVKQTPGVKDVAPFVLGPVLAEFEGRRIAPKIRGVDPKLEAKVTDLQGLMADKDSQGTFDLEGDSAVVGVELARTLHLQLGDKLTIYSPRNLEAVINELKKVEGGGADKAKIAEIQSMITPATLTVTGIFKSGRYVYDAEFIFVPLHIGQELYEMGDGVHGLGVRTVDPYRADQVKQALLNKLEPPLNALTWMDLNAQFFDAVRTERSTMFIILFFMLIVAAFCVMNTLITVTVQKTREIGIMKAVGADVWQIVRVFLAQGVVVGAFGMISGLGLAMGILALRNPFKHWMETALGIHLFPATVYQFSEIPAVVRPLDVSVICLGAFLLCSVAALIPAYFAARLDPVKALRFE